MNLNNDRCSRFSWQWVTILLLFFLMGCNKAHRGDDLLGNLKNLPAAKIEAELPNQHPSAFYGYAIRLFDEGKKDDSVFWFYVGQLRWRFYLKANPKLDPSGDAAAFGSLNAVIGQTINGYAGSDVKAWVGAVDRALKWDADNPNGFTSKENFVVIYEELRSGLKKMRDQLESQGKSMR